MAKPINQIEYKTKTPEEEQADSLAEILSLLAKNKDSIKTALEIVEELKQAGLLDIIQGLLKSRKKVGVIAVEQLNQPGMHNTIKNGIQAVQLLGELDPVKLNTLLQAANQGLEHTAKEDKKLSKWGLIKSMNDPGVLSSLSLMIGFLKGMGKGLNEQKQVH